jgi:uridine phosphorylase
MEKEELHERQHHIDMVVGDIAPTVLTPRFREVVDLFASMVDNAKKVAQKREYLSYIGESDGVKISCTSTGIGTSPTAIAAEELVRIDAKNIIRLGVCETLKTDIKPGDLIIVLGAVRDERATEEFIPIDYPALADFRIVRALIDACENLSLPYHLGIVRTHDAYYLDSPYAEDNYMARMEKWIDMGVIAIDTESSALLVIAGMQGVRAGALLLSGYPLSAGVKQDPQFEAHKKNLIQAGIEAAKVLHQNELD